MNILARWRSIVSLAFVLSAASLACSSSGPSTSTGGLCVAAPSNFMPCSVLNSECAGPTGCRSCNQNLWVKAPAWDCVCGQNALNGVPGLYWQCPSEPVCNVGPATFDDDQCTVPSIRDGGRDATADAKDAGRSSRDAGMDAASANSHDAAALGTPYACTGGFILSRDGGDVTAGPDAGNSATCVVGQSYCQIESLDKVVGTPPVHACGTVVDGGLGVCSETPTCACLCAQGIICRTECSCSDHGGFATVTCHQI